MPSSRMPFVRTATRYLWASAATMALAACAVTETPTRPLRSDVAILGCAAEGSHLNTVEAPPSPGSQPPFLAVWEEAMVDFGRRRGDELLGESSFQARLDMQYYDGQRVFLQIAEYTGEPEPWETYAAAAEATYKRYLEGSDFRPAGYMRFPHGLYMDWARHGDEQSRDYLLRLRDNGPFSTPEDPTYAKKWRDARYSREIAYALETQILAERAGAPAQLARVDRYVDMALGHVDAWLTGEFGHDERQWRFCQAFMTGLTASALIAYDDHLAATDRPRDPRVLPRIRRLADWLWHSMWVAGVGGSGGEWYPYAGAEHGAFEYVQPATRGVGSENPAPDLNLLIAPMYGWLWQQTREPRFRDRGDAVFEGGVAMGTLQRGKTFNQSYRSSFDYVAWRGNAATGNAQ